MIDRGIFLRERNNRDHESYTAMKVTKPRQTRYGKPAGNDRIATKIANYFALKWSENSHPTKSAKFTDLNACAANKNIENARSEIHLGRAI